MTFNKDIAPLVFEHCATCHRPGQSAPFALLTFNDVKKRARQIAEVTARRYMPPWLPEGARGEFIGDRRLSDAQIQAFRQWLEGGTPEGLPGELPPIPQFPAEWQLGKPDLVLQMPSKYTLSAEGRDVYRNFVIPVPLTNTKFVRAVEFRAENARIVHHAFIKVDYSGRASELDGTNGQPGFDGMNLPENIKMPGGYFLSWQPGKMTASEAPGFGWTLEPGQNLVLQAHLRPSGKPEAFQARVGLYFTDARPTNVTMILALNSLNIDIPSGANSYLVQDSFVLPVDAEVLAVLPHTHYLGKRLEGTAFLPDGRRRALLRIADWDFNWQGDYRYTKPMRLPAGTKLEMRFFYDNSAANPRNPNQPPKRVRYGPQSSDEMAELWFQVRLNNGEDATRLGEAYNEKQFQVIANYARFRLDLDPHDSRARTELGFAEWSQGQTAQAIENLRAAMADDASYDQPHYYLGVIYRTQNRLAEARAEFETAIKLNSKHWKAFGNLACVFLALGNLDAAESNIREALRLNPGDEPAREVLDQVQKARTSSAPK